MESQTLELLREISFTLKALTTAVGCVSLALWVLVFWKLCNGEEDRKGMDKTHLTEDDRRILADKIARDFFQSMATAKELREKSNSEIAELLLHYTWGDFELFTPQSDLIMEAIERLSGMGESDERTDI